MKILLLFVLTCVAVMFFNRDVQAQAFRNDNDGLLDVGVRLHKHLRGEFFVQF